ncbi:sulfotransferase family protein [Mesorhizobium xinjiangense]|uniref:sulfotransferase family protein n=1 Tax=Mesorhizobium xinjiangense TaxID=2678685 RepID=UPI0012EE02DF|nr:sulfotransferase family protein [Mesorhizobium xinjiangense]
MSKIIGIGWAKTGTTTLGHCFTILGYDHQSQDLSLVEGIRKGDLSAIMARAEQKESFEDWPWIILYRELDRAFPGSRFVLTVRDADKWIGSYTNMLANKGIASDETNRIRETLYGLPFPDVTKAQLVERYQRHNDDVKRYFRDRPDDLLVVDWEDGCGWKELCDFLGREIPRQPFPHANRGRYSAQSPMRRLFAKLTGQPVQ